MGAATLGEEAGGGLFHSNPWLTPPSPIARQEALERILWGMGRESFFLCSLQESYGGGAERGKILPRRLLGTKPARKKGEGSMMNAGFLLATGLQTLPGRKTQGREGKEMMLRERTRGKTRGKSLSALGDGVKGG